MTGPPGDPLKIVVATLPSGHNGALSLRREVELVRAAILYADEIELVSPGAQMVSEMSDLTEGDLSGWFGLMSALPDEIIGHYNSGNPLPDNWRTVLPHALTAISLGPDVLRRLPGGDQMTDAQVEQLRNYPGQLDEVLQNVRDHMNAVLEDTEGEELRPAIRAGIIKVTPVMGMGDLGDMSDLPYRFMELLRELLHDRGVRLLLDESVANIANHMVNAGLVTPHQITLQHAGEAAVGSGLVARLPAFVEAPIDELLDLRKDLAIPLTRYRRAVSKMASSVAAAPFDPSIPHLIDDLWRNEVSPALDELREQLGDSGLVREMVRQLGKDLKDIIAALSGPGLWVGLSSIDSLDGLTAAAAGLAPVLGAGAHAAAGVAEDRRGRRSSAEKHDMFYLYEVQNRLQT